ncbi:MAG: hypothetical protein JXA07_15040 [Spirochaetes bacterium]|nr:hypothetical protein [Spirochaetota bacterium]
MIKVTLFLKKILKNLTVVKKYSNIELNKMLKRSNYMKKIGILGILAVAGIVSISTHLVAQRMHAARYYYNAASVVRVSGEITAVDSVAAAWGYGAGTHLVIKTKDGSLTVYAGPSYFLKDKISFVNGDSIEVTGARTDEGGKPGIIAREIVKGDKKVVLRHEDGSPLWTGQGRRGGRR